MTLRIYAAFGLFLCAVALCLTACGGGDSTASGDGLLNTGSAGAGSESGGSTISKAALIKQGDAICNKTDDVQKAALKKYEKEKGLKLATQPEIEAGIEVAALPPIATEIEELEALGVPAGDEAEVGAILSGLKSALEATEAKPGTLLEGSGEGAFAAPDKLAAAYGFEACAKAL